MFYEQRSEFTEQDFTHLVAMIRTLRTKFSFAIINNFKRLADPIKGSVNEMKIYIEEVQKSQKPLDFNPITINELISSIKPRLIAAYQDGFLVTANFMNFISQSLWDEKVKNAAEPITNQVGKLLGVFAVYINSLNQKSQEDKCLEKRRKIFIRHMG